MPLYGQRPALETLRRALRRERVPHAWIFHGPFGVGKFTAAVELARLLLDPGTTDAHIDRFEAPREGAAAALFAAGTHPDLHVVRRELAAASRLATLRSRKLTNIPLDLVRELMIGGRVDDIVLPAPLGRRSIHGRGKVFIVDEAELLDSAAQDALLKTLEEPPPDTWVILVTTREERMRPTVRSRCQRAVFVPLTAEEMARWAAAADGDGALPAAGPARDWLLRFADGAPGAAAFAGRHGLAAWPAILGPIVESWSAGRFEPGAADALFKLVDGLAEGLVKERSSALRAIAPPTGDEDGPAGDDDEGDGDSEEPRATGPKGSASVAAAKRDAAGWLFAVLADEARQRLRAGVERDDDVGAALRLLDLLPQAQRQLDDNVNLRNALADLSALAAAPAVATIPFTGVVGP